MGNSDGEESSPSAEGSEGVSLDAIPLHSTNLLTVLDADGVIHYESPAIQRILGYEQDALVGERVAEYFHPEDREEVLDAFHNVVSGTDDAVATVEYRHEQADGTYCWVESVTSADTTPAGRYVVNTRDISDRRAREQELIASNERLDAFTTALSHDLRNPLQVAQGRLELIAETADSEHLTAIERAHDRMQVLIEDLLALARLEKSTVDEESVELPAVVTDSWRTADTGEATLVPPTSGVIRADRSRLQQLLANLFRNAVEHGSTIGQLDSGKGAVERGGDVTVTVGVLDDGFYVADDGPGIPEDERDAVFDAGYSTQAEGTGFGLHIVEQVVEDHGWDVHIIEGSDGGTRFDITGVEFVP